MNRPRRFRISIEEPMGTYSPATGSAGTWTTVCRTWATIEPLQGRERLLASQTEGLMTHRIGMKYVPNLTPRMRVVEGTRVFQLLALTNVGGRNRDLELDAVERQ